MFVKKPQHNAICNPKLYSEQKKHLIPSNHFHTEYICKIDIFVFVLILLVAAIGSFFWVVGQRKSIIVLSIMAIIIIIGLWVWYKSTGDKYPFNFASYRAFPVAFVILACTFSLFFAPGTVPDEGYHFIQSYKYSNLIIPGMAIGDFRADDLSFYDDSALFTTSVSRECWSSLIENTQAFSSNTSIISNSDLADATNYAFDVGANPPQLKLPSALGIALARLLGLSSILLFYMGRFFNIIFASILICLAVRITPIGRNAMMAAALLPMTLHLVGSYSYDAGIIGISFLFVAMALRAIYRTEKITIKEISELLIISALLAPCKVVYTVLIAMLFLIPCRRFPTRRQAAIFKITVILVPIAVILALRIPSLIQLSVMNADKAGGNHRGDETGSFYTLSYIICHPTYTVYLCMNTLYTQCDFYLKSLLGGTLGWFQASIATPMTASLLPLGVLCLSVLSGAPDDSSVLQGKARALMGLIVFVCVLLIIVSMMLGWTFDTETVVQGVQGRYFLPILPVFLFALRSKSFQTSLRIGFGLVLIMSAYNLICLANIAAIMPAA